MKKLPTDPDCRAMALDMLSNTLLALGFGPEEVAAARAEAEKIDSEFPLRWMAKCPCDRFNKEKGNGI